MAQADRVTASGLPVQAFVDESCSHRGLDPNTYILGAVVVDPADLGNARSVAAELLLPGQMKTHWRDDLA